MSSGDRTRRMGDICDNCGLYNPIREPAATVQNENGDWLSLCVVCYEDEEVTARAQ